MPLDIERRTKVAVASGCVLAVTSALLIWLKAASIQSKGTRDQVRFITTADLEETSDRPQSPGTLGDKVMLDASPPIVEEAVSSRREILGERLGAVYAALEPHRHAWNREDVYAQYLRPVVADIRLDDLVELMTHPPAESSRERHEAAVARVVGLKIFDVLVSDERLDDAAMMLESLVIKTTGGMRPPKNFELDVEHMIRVYFTSRAEHQQLFADPKILANELERLGVPLERLLKERMSTPFSSGALRGLAMAYFATTGDLNFEQWITQT